MYQEMSSRRHNQLSNAQNEKHSFNLLSVFISPHNNFSVPCESGSYKDTSMKTCQQCPTNTYSAASAGLCIPCPQRTLANKNRTKCGNTNYYIIFTCRPTHSWDNGKIRLLYSCSHLDDIHMRIRFEALSQKRPKSAYYDF